MKEYRVNVSLLGDLIKWTIISILFIDYFNIFGCSSVYKN